MLLMFHPIWAAQKAEIDPQTLQNIVQRSVKIERAWGSQMNSPGASADVTEIYRKPGQGQTLVAYHVSVHGLPSDKIYILAKTEIVTGKVTPVLQGVTLGKDGLLICAGRENTCGDAEKPDDPIDLVLPAQKGEGHHLAVISEDGQSKAFFMITPFPDIATDHGCTLELRRLMPQAALVYAKASGFSPGETVKLESASEIESHDGAVRADSDGTWDSAFLPAVKGMQSGKFRVTARGKSCAPSATMDWGPASNHNE